MIFLDNISQQTNNEDFLRYNIKIRYRTYRYYKLERSNLIYNIIRNKRYY